MNYESSALNLSKEYFQKEKELIIDVQSNPKVMYKRRVGFVCVLDYFSNIFLHRSFVRHYCIRIGFTNIDSYNYKKYSLASFINSSKNITTCISRLRSYMWGIQNENIERVLEYAEQLLSVLEELKVTFEHFKPSKYNMPRPYCCFCWKRIDSSSLSYCEDHHPNSKTNDYNKANRRLEYALMEKQPNEYNKYKEAIKNKRNLTGKRFMCTEFFALPSKKLEHELSINNIFLSNFVDNFHLFRKICSKYYPISSKTLNTLENVHADTWQTLILRIITEFDKVNDNGNEGAYWEAKGIESWMKPKENYDRLTVLISLIRRYEAYSYIQKMYSSDKKENEVRNQIISMAANTKRSEIEKKLKVSKQYISKVLLQRS